MSRSLRLSLAGAALLIAMGCSRSFSSPSPAGTANLSANLQFCIDQINAYRSSVGRPLLTRSDSLESFAAQAVQHDANAGVPHLFFQNTNGGGIARAETELLLWRNYAVRDVIRQGLAQMWGGGPGSEHYAILTGPYTEAGCGVFVNGTAVSIAQDFR